MTKVWGPHVWTFLHCFCEKLNNNFFNLNKMEIIIFIKTIMFNLPCPLCSNDTIIKFKMVNYKKIKTKDELKMLIFYYHNNVNKKLKKKKANIEILEKYKNYNIYKCYKKFLNVYAKRYKFKLNVYSHTFLGKRNIATRNIIKWWNINHKKCFN